MGMDFTLVHALVNHEPRCIILLFISEEIRAGARKGIRFKRHDKLALTQD